MTKPKAKTDPPMKRDIRARLTGDTLAKFDSMKRALEGMTFGARSDTDVVVFMLAKCEIPACP